MTTQKSLLAIALSFYIVNILGCGVLLYPERQGQKSGKIDPAVALLDGIGILLYIIPGLIAFAVDFHQGTIYLPGGLSDADSPNSNTQAGLREVKINGPVTKENIEATIRKELQLEADTEVNINALNVQAIKINKSQLYELQGFALRNSETKFY